MGNDDLREMEFGQMDPAGRDLTNAGRILGMVATIVFIFQLVLMLIVFVVMALSPGR